MNTSLNVTVGARSPGILLVEDSEDLGFLLQYVLEREGYHVTRLSDGQQATQYIASELPPSLVILDIMLPYRSGLELLSQLRAMAHWLHVPVIVMSAMSADDRIVWALDHGANEYVSKPLSPNQLIARVRSHLRKSL